MKYINIVQIILSVLLVATILLQQRGGGIGSSFGGGDQFYSTRRGVEKIIFLSTIVIAALFLATALVRIILIK